MFTFARFVFATVLLVAPRPFDGAIIEGRMTASATIFLWEATPYVTRLVHDRVLGTAGLREMEATGVGVLVKRAKGVHSRGIELRALYQKTGAVSPIYQVATLEGVEHVFTMRADVRALQRNAAAWTTDLRRGIRPRGLAIDVTGSLPPP
jgi:hypothetical protein